MKLSTKHLGLIAISLVGSMLVRHNINQQQVETFKATPSRSHIIVGRVYSDKVLQITSNTGVQYGENPFKLASSWTNRSYRTN